MSSLLLAVVVVALVLAGCSQNLYGEVDWSQLPESVQGEVTAAVNTAGAYVFANGGVDYLLLTTGEEQRLSQHVKYLNKGSYDKESKTLTLYFEQYVPQTGKPGTEISSEDWYLFMRIRKSSASQIKIVINEEERYILDMPE
jgi:hypothetical protein